MGAACCAPTGAAAQEVLTEKNVQHHFVRQQDTHFEESYDVVQIIGEGSISQISKIKKKGSESSDGFYALKEINLGIIQKAHLDELTNEIKLLSGLDHPNIIKAYETYHLRNKLAIVLEICTGGDLYSRHPYTERQAADILIQVLSAVAYLHDRNIVHRDLKHENIMFANTKSDQIKIIDFGLAKKFLYTGDRHSERVGSLYTMAPEVMSGNYFGASSDMWSIGVIVFMLISGDPPFWGKRPQDLIRAVRRAEVKFNAKAWQTSSSDSKDFVQKLLKSMPESRLTAKQALAHPFIKNRKSLSETRSNPKLVENILGSLVRYAKSSEFKKLALLVIANKMNSEEIMELRDAFVQFDKEKDGMLSMDEFRDCLSQSNFTENEIETMFSQVDVNHTGNILYTEFLASTLEAKGHISQRKLADAFHELDCDNSGYISKEDLRKILPHDTSDVEIQKMIAEVDTADRDGRISFEEFQQAFNDATRSNVSILYEASEQPTGTEVLVSEMCDA